MSIYPPLRRRAAMWCQPARLNSDCPSCLLLNPGCPIAGYSISLTLPHGDSRIGNRVDDLTAQARTFVGKDKGGRDEETLDHGWNRDVVAAVGNAHASWGSGPGKTASAAG